MITNASGDIFEYGPQHCDAIVVWGRTGLNAFRLKFEAFAGRIRESRHHLASQAGEAIPLGAEPWCTEHAATAITITPPLNRLRVVYFIPNRENAGELADDALGDALSRGIEAVAESGAVSVALNSARAPRLGGSPAEHVALDEERVRLTRTICARWLAKHPHSPLQDIHLVSLDEAFSRS